MKAGFSSLEITPEPGVDLQGFAIRPQPSKEVLDPLYVRIAYLREKVEVLIVVFDLLALTSQQVSELSRFISRETGISANHIILLTTHTHSAPASFPLLQCGRFIPDYFERYKPDLLEKIEEARTTSEPCTMFTYTTQCSLSIDRRGDASFVDHEVRVWGFQDKNKKIKGLLYNYPMHPVCLKGDGISADFPGISSSIIKEKLGCEEAIFMNGFCGNINPPKEGVDYEELRKNGELLASAVLENIDGKLEFDGPLSACRHSIFVRAREDTHEKVEREYDRLKGLAPGDFREKYFMAMEEWRETMLGRIENGWDGTIEIVITVVSVGNLTLAGVGAEVFSSLSKLISKQQNIFLAGYCNGMVGYIPDDIAFKSGGYEVDSSKLFFNMPGTPLGTQGKVVDEINSIILKQEAHGL